MELAITLSLMTFAAVAAVTSGPILHNWTSPAGLFMGLTAATWVGHPLMVRWSSDRYDTLKPPPKQYKIPWKHAFVKVRDIFARANYRQGAGHWNVDTADTQAKHIHATMKFMDEKTRIEASGIGNFHTTTDLAQRFIEVDVQFFERDEACVIQLDFATQIEGTLDYAAADFAIADIRDSIERELGPGEAVAMPQGSSWGAPPWWLLGLTAMALFTYGAAVFAMLIKQ